MMSVGDLFNIGMAISNKRMNERMGDDDDDEWMVRSIVCRSDPIDRSKNEFRELPCRPARVTIYYTWKVRR